MKEEQQIYGIRTVLEAISAEKPINKLFLQKGLSGPLFRELEHKARKQGLSVSYVPVERLNRFTQNNHQGAVAKIAPINFRDFETLIEEVLSKDGVPFLLLLDQVTDVRNFGAILRTAECTGVQAVIVPKSGSAPVNQDTVKTSAGGVFNVPISKVDHLKDAIYYLNASGVRIIAATEKTDKLLYNVDFNQPTALLMGSEGKGVSEQLLKLVDEKAKLPMLGDIDSLNVSVACGAFLYEVVRQRQA